MPSKQIDIHTTQHSVPSPDGALIAALQHSSLTINTYEGVALRSIPLALDIVSSCRYIRWSRVDDHSKERSQENEDEKQQWPCSRVLLADDDTVRVYDVHDAKWSAIVERAGSNFGRIADVAFGYTETDLLVFSDFGVKLTIWSLITCRGVEVRDPKQSSQCYAYRARTGHMAILTRSCAQDVLMLLNPRDHNLIKSIELPTVDAQEVLWSPDGRWLAIRDVASGGHKLLIYTADGHLFKMYTSGENSNEIGLGIKNMRWCSSHCMLALGDYNDNITLLSGKTFSPIANFYHPTTISVPDTIIWQEQVDASKIRSYTAAPQPASPLTACSLAKASHPSQGVSVICSNNDGTLLATKSESTPTTVWVWSLQTGSAVTILIHHSPVKRMSWHPTESDFLLIHCAIAKPVVHLWKPAWDVPQIVALHSEKMSGRLEASWLRGSTASCFNLLLSSTHRFTMFSISNAGELMPEVPNFSEGGKSMSLGEDMFDEGNSLNLSPIKITHDETLEVDNVSEKDDEDSGSSFGLGNEMVDDTFHYRRRVKAVS